MTFRAWIRNVLDVLSRRYRDTELDYEQLAFLAKQAELDQRIRSLEWKFQGLDGRTSILERRQGDDPSYYGPERRRVARFSH